MTDASKVKRCWYCGKNTMTLRGADWQCTSCDATWVDCSGPLLKVPVDTLSPGGESWSKTMKDGKRQARKLGLTT